MYGKSHEASLNQKIQCDFSINGPLRKLPYGTTFMQTETI
jgi:hypothetical protein